ncbi:hypothetical protein [Streptomyces griseoluteus]|uniref:hypothetical protein n=1 Tax=Streptomyces griseoluteus TaxID=29306 RepID=UPI00381BDB44
MRTLPSSPAVASILADAVMGEGSTVLHTIGGDPYRLARKYRERHRGGRPAVNRMGVSVHDVPEDLVPDG